jgi:sortase (surface protein transpeptidase)
LKLFRLIWAAGLVVGLSFVLTPPARAMAAAPTGFLRVGHFVPGAGAVSIDIDGHALVGSLSFQQVTSYVAVPAGSHTLEVVVPGARGGPAQTHTAAETVAPGGFLTVLVVADATGVLRVSSFSDNLSQPATGDAKVRFIDSLATLPALGGNLTAVPDPAVPRTVVVPATTEGEASPYLDVRAGVYNVEFTNARTGVAVLSGKNWPVSAGTVASLVVLQGTSGPTLEVLKDAVGAASLPAGGMQTGAGGMALRAQATSSGWLGVELGLVVVVALATIILVRRARVPLGLAAVACASGLVASSCSGEASTRAATPPVTTTGLRGWSPPAEPANQPRPGARSISLAAAGTADASNQPERISAPSVGIDAPIVNLGRLPDGTMQVPASFAVAGWYDEGPPPGEPGPAVIIGHVDSTTGPAVFWRLRDLRPGDHVIITSARATETFEVTLLLSAPKAAFPTERVFGPVADPELRLITCSGPFDRSTGHYVDNTIVFARQVQG